MSETTEVHKCPVCEGSGWIYDNLNLSMTTASMKLCNGCNGAGIITTDIVTPFSGESEEFPDKEIFRMGTEEFNEVFEDKFLIWTYHDIKEIYLEEHHLYKVIKKYVGVGDKVKLSCKPGKIVIERREEKEHE